MKRITLCLIALGLLPLLLASQSDQWPVKAINKSGKTIPIMMLLEDDTTIPVFAIFEAENDHFMDVKGVHNGENISIKLIASNDVLVPVKGVSKDGDIYRVKAVDTNGNIIDVKGVSRDGNTLKLAAIASQGNHLPIMAISPTGLQREVKGVKFVGQNVELEFGDIQVIAHVKALPTIDVGDVDSKWDIGAITNNNETLKLVATSSKGKAYPVKAEMDGSYPYLMNVRASARIVIHIKLVKNDNKLVVTGIDEYGRLYTVRAVSDDGEAYLVYGGESTGNVTPIYVQGDDDNTYPVKAISSGGHQFDVKGLKVKKDDVEGVISGLNEWIRYYAHIKALAPRQNIE
ncbi:MAG: hypothetical protein HKN09_06710 [Saprospiraceae bacterium]|nr:hypothetical protein [Saprospiraceae bacterium]